MASPIMAIFNKKSEKSCEAKWPFSENRNNHVYDGSDNLKLKILKFLGIEPIMIYQKIGKPAEFQHPMASNIFWNFFVWLNLVSMNLSWWNFGVWYLSALIYSLVLLHCTLLELLLYDFRLLGSYLACVTVFVNFLRRRNSLFWPSKEVMFARMTFSSVYVFLFLGLSVARFQANSEINGNFGILENRILHMGWPPKNCLFSKPFLHRYQHKHILSHI